MRVEIIIKNDEGHVLSIEEEIVKPVSSLAEIEQAVQSLKDLVLPKITGGLLTEAQSSFAQKKD